MTSGSTPESDERRRRPRYIPLEDVVGMVRSVVPGLVIDISPEGVQLEVETALRPNAEVDFSLPVGGTQLRLRAVVRRCKATGMRPKAVDENSVVYRAGLEFVRLGDEARAVLEARYGDGGVGPDGRPRPVTAGRIRIRVNPDDLVDSRKKGVKGSE
jgi:hypothetical protein